VATLPDYITREYPELVNILPEEHSPPIPVFFVYPEELRRSQRVLAFRDFMVNEVNIFSKEQRVMPRVASSA
jgi:DNA-binding transcriptional LysR family regulator